MRRSGSRDCASHGRRSGAVVRQIVRAVVPNELAAEFGEGAGFDVRAGLRHEVQVEVEVVRGDEAEAEDFLGLHEVAEVAAGKGAAGGAGAAVLDRAGVASLLSALSSQKEVRAKCAVE